MRWAISPIIGTGTAADPYRAKVAEYGGHAALIPGNTDGTPAALWALALIADDAVALAEDDTEVVVLPDLGPSDTITPDLIPIGRGTVDQPNLFEWVYLTMVETVEGLGQQLEPDFSYDWMQLPE